MKPPTTALILDALLEVDRARKLFPSPDHLAMAFAEEAGEVVRAVNDLRTGKATEEDLIKEIKQTIAMCVRLYEEGDPVENLKPLGAPWPEDQD